MRAARAMAHNENRNQVMPYISRLRVSTSSSTHHEGAKGGEGVCVTRKVLCESWVAESLDDSIVRALPTSQGRSGRRSHEECVTQMCVRDELVKDRTKDRLVGGHIPSDRERNTWAPERGRRHKDGASLTIDRQGG